jgi:opacity protein-like surface antigen
MTNKPQLRLRSFTPKFITFAVLLLLPCFGKLALAQEKPASAADGKFTPSLDVSLGLDAELTGARMPTTTISASNGTGYTQVTQGASPAAGVFGTLHQSFTPWLGYNVNFGYTRFSENYSNGQESVPTSTSTLPTSSSFIRGSVRTNMYDLTIASVIEGPRTRRFNTFVQVGGGGLFFEPINSKIGATQETRPALLFGAGANFKLTRKLSLRAEYRGFLYKSPDFGIQDITPGLTATNQFPMTRLFTVTSSPAVSLVYRFGRTGPAKPVAQRP